MPLTLQDLLDDPGLGLRLVAGRRGLRGRGPVRWVHSSEIPDPTPWLEGGELLLTTGLGVRDDPALQRRLVTRLSASGCAGVGFGVGVVVGEVPEAMVAAAEEVSLPLFTVPYEVPFIAVAKEVSRRVFDDHYATLRSGVDLHRRVLGRVLAGAGAAGVLEVVAEQMPGFAWVLYDYFGAVLARVGRRPLDVEALWTAAAAHGRPRDRFCFRCSGQQVVGATIRLGGEAEAVLAVVGDRELSEHEALLLEQGLTGVSLELARGLSVRELHRNRVDVLLEEIAHDGIGRAMLAAQLARAGLDVEAPFRVLCVTRPRDLSERGLCTLVEDVVAGLHATPVVGRHDGRVLCFTQPPEVAYAERIADAAVRRGWRGVTVGRSTPRHDVGDLRAALREAVAAAAAGNDARRVVDVTELGLAGLLAGLGDGPRAQAFVARVLGPVLAHDAAEGSQLVSTLRRYLDHGCRPGPAAAELSIHRHTLAYRLERVRALTGRDPRDGEHLLEFGLALELLAREAH